MAQNLQLLKRRIKTAQNIAQIAKAMEMIAASKVKRAQQEVFNSKEYSHKIIELTKSLIGSRDMESFSHPYLVKNNSSKKLILVIAPDKGLCGALVTNLLKKLLEIDSENITYITVGKKIQKVTAILKGRLLASFPMGTRLPQYGTIYPILKLIDEEYKKGHVGSVEIVFTKFNSLFNQTPTEKLLLPIIASNTQNEKVGDLSYIFEPNMKIILESLLPYYIEVSLFHTLLESYTSEQVARMIAMQNAKNNAKDIADALTLTYNKSRQEKITNELLDLNNGSIAV